jgi:CheY-like chemotaxis protein
MPTTDQSLRVLVVDDNRDGADALGLLVEELGNQVHVTYGGTQALDVATAFRPDLMLVDLVMPEMDGCGLVIRLRQIPAFAQTKIVAITGQKGQEHKSLAMKAGFDAVLFKPVTLKEIEDVLAGAGNAHVAQSPRPLSVSRALGTEQRLPIGGLLTQTVSDAKRRC